MVGLEVQGVLRAWIGETVGTAAMLERDTVMYDFS